MNYIKLSDKNNTYTIQLRAEKLDIATVERLLKAQNLIEELLSEGKEGEV